MHNSPSKTTLQAVKELPDSYTYYHALNLSHWKFVLLTNLAALLLLFVFGWLFIGLAAALHPQFFILNLTIFAQLLQVSVFVVTMVVVVVLHELLHALFFWLFTYERPKIGFNLLYAYAAAPGWHFPRNQFILIGAAPLIFITLGGLIGILLADFVWIPRFVLAMTINAAGAVGDLIVIIWMMTQPVDALVKDDGPKITLYRKVENGDASIVG